MLELLKPYSGQILSFVLGVASGVVGAWAAFGRKIRSLDKRVHAVELAQTVTNTAIGKLEATDRRLETAVQQVADAYNRIEGRLDELSDLAADVRAANRQLAELSGQMKLYPQLIEQLVAEVRQLKRDS